MLIAPLYKAIVRLRLEYRIQAWRTYRKKDIDTLERIQRLREDRIEVSKILNGYENIDRIFFISLKKDSRIRGHEVTLVKDQCTLDIIQITEYSKMK